MAAQKPSLTFLSRHTREARKRGLKYLHGSFIFSVFHTCSQLLMEQLFHSLMEGWVVSQHGYMNMKCPRVQVGTFSHQLVALF